MNVFVLPGNNSQTESWAVNLLKELEAPHWTTRVQHYKHWDSDETQFVNIKDEVERLQGCRIDLLMAKSVGVRIGLLAYTQGIIAPQRFISIGTPMIGFRKEKMALRALVAKLKVPCLFIQQTNDKAGSCVSLREEIADLPLVELVEIPGEDHLYSEVKLLAQHIKHWL
jgi:pimeloyl-ACP methyl ester carboxylesterase